MELRGIVKELAYNNAGKPIIKLEIDRLADVNNVRNLKIDERYKIRLNQQGNNRTLEQNNLLWGIIADIDKKQNGVGTETGRWDLYTYGIEQMGIEYDDYLIPANAIEIMRSGCRALRILEDLGDFLMVRCFTGSSKFNKAQMGELIDYYLRMASDLGIPLVDYREQYNELF